MDNIFVRIIPLLVLLTKCSSETVLSPTVTFNNGLKIPILGLGTWKSNQDEVGNAVKYAIDIGYRHFDCAYIYQNEKEIGAAIAEKIAAGAVKRDDLFITSKLWNTFHRPAAVEDALKITLKDLGLAYVDLYLIHWPIEIKEGQGRNESSEYDYVDTWMAMEALYKKGLARSIGISNFNKRQIERILERATVIPVTNQVECNPYVNQNKLFEFCKSKNITLTAYAPLGSPYKAVDKPNHPILLENPKIKEIARKLQKTSAQILLRYQIQRGVIAIPKSVKKTRIAENFQVFDFVLSATDMEDIDSLNVNDRLTKVPDWRGHKNYPFNDEY